MDEYFFYNTICIPLQNRFNGIDDAIRSSFRYKSSEPFTLTTPIPQEGNKNFVFNGCHLSNLTIVGYQPQKIVCGQLNSISHYGVSFEFSGCAMAKFIDFANKSYVCHIYLNSGESGDCRELWKSFIDKCSFDLMDVVIFKPYTPLMKKLYMHFYDCNIKTTVCGVICPDGECYSLLMRRDNFWIIYCEKVTPLFKNLFVASFVDREKAKAVVDIRING